MNLRLPLFIRLPLCFFYILSLPLCTQVIAQNAKIDSLKKLLVQSKADTNRVNLYYQVCKAYFRVSSDSSIKIAQQSLALAQKLNYKKGMADAYNGIGVSYYFKGNYPKAIENYQKAMDIHTLANNELGLSQIYNNLGIIYKRQGDYPNALKYYHKSLKLQEKLKNQRMIALLTNNLGTVYLQLADYPQSLQYFQKALVLKEKLNMRKGSLALTHNNISVVLTKMGQYKKGMAYAKKSLEICKQANLFQPMAGAYNQLGEIKVNQNQLDSAVYYQQNAVRNALKAKAKAIQMRAVNSLGEVYLKQKKYTKAQESAQEALQLAQQSKELPVIKDASYILYQCASQQRNYAQALKYQTLYMQSKDSLFNDDKTKALTRMEMNFAFEKKQALLQAAQKAKEEKVKIENDKKLQRQQFYLLSALGALLAALVIAVFVFRSRQIQRKLNKQLVNQKNELTQLNEELQQNHEEIVSQRDFIEKQNQSLNHQQTRIESSFKVAQAIQQALLPSQKSLEAFFQDHFIIYRPKDIVSGDFYWVKQVGDQVITVAADCTGHGVPGAFMSLIGINLLDNIIYKDKITDPQIILDRLHELLNEALYSKDSNYKRAGMDVVIFSISKTTPEQVSVVFAGAKNPLYYFLPNDDQIHTLKGSRKSVGGDFSATRYFKNYEVTLPVGSIIYVGSDGFQDQNDVHRRSFTTTRLVDLLEAAAALPFEQQKNKLEHHLDEHMKDTTQRDDILWLGIKV